jgi:hypothetical protein
VLSPQRPGRRSKREAALRESEQIAYFNRWQEGTPAIKKKAAPTGVGAAKTGE